MLILATLALSALQAPSPPQAPPIPATLSACGKVNCTCGCANGAPCVCAAPKVTHNYDVGNGRIVVASSWAEAYKKAGISAAVPAPASPVYAPQAYTVPQAAPAAYGSAYSPSYAFPQAYGGYSMPSYGSYGGASCPAGG